MVRLTRLELAQLKNRHYHLKVACLPIPPQAQIINVPTYYTTYSRVLSRRKSF